MDGSASPPAGNNSAGQRYKPSRFNVRTVAPDGSVVLRNILTSATCVIPARAAAHLGRYLSRKGVDGDLDGLGRYLLDAGFIIKHEVDEDARWDVLYGMTHWRSDALHLVLLSSEDCNFRCVYCSQPFRMGTMRPEIRTGIRTYVEAHAPKLRVLRIGWFGGEPLLGFDAIADIAPRCSELARAHCIQYSSHITTNGYLLTPERARLLVGWGITGFQVTIDGPPDQHNKKRPLKDGGPTYDQILSNLAAMKGVEGSFSVRIRVNFDRENVRCLEPFLRSVKAAFADDRRFVLGFNPVGRWGGKNDRTLDVIKQDVIAHLRCLRNEAAAHGIHTESVARSLQPINRVCFATMNGAFLIGADGRIMKCTNHGAIPDEINVVGQVHENGQFELDSDKCLRWITPYYRYDPRCARCFYLPACRGGLICPAARVRGRPQKCCEEKMQMRNLLLEFWKERTALGQEKRIVTTVRDAASGQAAGTERSERVDDGSMTTTGCLIASGERR